MPMIASPPSLTSEEQEQLLQTIEMFEVIVQASPHDCQSLEILKDAYNKVQALAWEHSTDWAQGVTDAAQVIADMLEAAEPDA